MITVIGELEEGKITVEEITQNNEFLQSIQSIQGLLQTIESF